MDRKYKRAETINVYADQAAKDAGTPCDRIQAVTYSHVGFDNYMYQGRIYPGYFDRLGPAADGCIILQEST